MDVEEYRTGSWVLHRVAEAHSAFADPEGDHDSRVCYFPCPFCYLDIEVSVLCAHLQEEHCFDVKNAVCPVCAENLERDAIGHFTMQHSHLLKKMMKSQRSDLWTNGSKILFKVKEVQEVSSYPGVSSTSNSAPDPLLSPFLCGISLPSTKSDQEANNDLDAGVASTSLHTESQDLSRIDENGEEVDGEKRHRIEFARQLILSTIFPGSPSF